jgi:hypothetical protein
VLCISLVVAAVAQTTAASQVQVELVAVAQEVFPTMHLGLMHARALAVVAAEVVTTTTQILETLAEAMALLVLL